MAAVASQHGSHNRQELRSSPEDVPWPSTGREDVENTAQFAYGHYDPLDLDPTQPSLYHDHDSSANYINGSTMNRPRNASIPSKHVISQLPAKAANTAETSDGFSDRLEITRPKYGDMSRIGSEADSLLDLYRQQRSGQNTAHTSAVAVTAVNGSSEEDMWVHRDKLVAIEQREAREKGINLPADHSRLRKRESDHDTEQTPHRVRSDHSSVNEKRQKVDSPSSIEDEKWTNEVHSSWDPRTPEEIAQDPYEEGIQSPRYTHHGLRSSSSRIPLATSSPLPIAPEHLARNTPLPRKRDMSGNWDEDGLVYSKIRSRSHSMGSQVLLDDGEPVSSAPNSPTRTSPIKARIPTKTNPTSGPKKASVSSRNGSTAYKPRVSSSTPRGSPAQRPSTRSGSDGRPTTAVNRPPGDAPWLASMYKPDPRLPPDQQILPTHAKRLQQEQWEREGKPGSTFDREFAPLAVYPSEENTMPVVPDLPAENPDEKFSGDEHSTTWPLKPPPTEVSKQANGTTEHAGYSTIPKVQTTPSIGPIHSPKLPQPMQVQQPVKQEKEKGCGCCIIM